MSSSPSSSLSLIPSSPTSSPTLQRSLSNNIIVSSNANSNMNQNRAQSNILPSRANVCINIPQQKKVLEYFYSFDLIVTNSKYTNYANSSIESNFCIKPTNNSSCYNFAWTKTSTSFTIK